MYDSLGSITDTFIEIVVFILTPFAQIMGLWYGSEVITHIGSEEGESIYDTCVVIHLSDITNSVSIDRVVCAPYQSMKGGVMHS